MRAHAAKDGIRAFDWLWSFLRICRIRSYFPGPREIVEKNQEPVYRDSWFPCCQSCIPAGIFATYMTDWDIESSMEFPDFLLHIFILHKPLIFTTSLKRFVIKSRYSFYAEDLLCPRWQVERKERTQRRFLPQKGAPRQRWDQGWEKNSKFFLRGGQKIKPSAMLVAEGWKDLMRWWIPSSNAFFHIRGREEGRGEGKRQEISLFTLPSPKAGRQ